ncbi:hypothetical protein T4B_5862 [Trichinella pseudospiralis]|uniref:Uncharacterized protein n=1 Tax=Trichinella pseudospiralis TaxID=6337 RepID=A0A0V1HUQ7_TRIPS|nr:hypothetical protein T4B_5862 [Trichinella pseudospiralis]KRZ37038.1 hypothetical protein T4C_9796 [Trichinella pseudospiralis]
MFHAINAAHHGGEKKTFREAQNKWATLHRTGTIWEHLGLRDLLPETDSNRRPVGTTETYPPGGDLRQKKRNAISAKASGGKCLERRKTSPVGLPTQRGELQCQPCPCPGRFSFAGRSPLIFTFCEECHKKRARTLPKSLVVKPLVSTNEMS